MADLVDRLNAFVLANQGQHNYGEGELVREAAQRIEALEDGLRMAVKACETTKGYPTPESTTVASICSVLGVSTDAR